MTKFIADEPITTLPVAWAKPQEPAPTPLLQEPVTIAQRMLTLFDKGRRWLKNSLTGRKHGCDDPAMCLLGALGVALHGERWVAERGGSTNSLINLIRDEPVARMLIPAINTRMRERPSLGLSKCTDLSDAFHFNDHGYVQWEDIEAVLQEVDRAERKYLADKVAMEPKPAQ